MGGSATSKKTLFGIICIDQSWRGMGLIAYEIGKKTIVFDDTDLIKLYYGDNGEHKISPSIEIQISYVKSYCNILKNLIPDIGRYNVLIAEKQFMTPMKNLTFMITNQLLSLMDDNVKLYLYSPLSVKRYYKLEIQKTHSENKRVAHDYTKEHKNDLIGGNICATHNISDSCLLLNMFLRKTKNTYFAIEMAARLTCPYCYGEAKEFLISKTTSEHYGKSFRSCRSVKSADNSKDSCCKEAKFVLNDDELYEAFIVDNEKIIIPKAQKRPFVAPRKTNTLAPPPKKRFKASETMEIDSKLIQLINDKETRLVQMMASRQATMVEIKEVIGTFKDCVSMTLNQPETEELSESIE